MIDTPSLPRIVTSGIENAYINIRNTDVVYTNFETSRLLTKTVDDTLTASVCSLTASVTGPNSGFYNVVRLKLFTRGFEESYTALTQEIGIYSLKKRFFDSKIKEGSFTASVSGVHADDYYDSGSGELKRKSGGNITVGAFLNDEGMMVVTSTSSSLTSITQSISSISYKAVVDNTELSVFCKCQPGEMNFTLNPTAFDQKMGSYMLEPFTASTSAAEYYSDLVLSGQNWTPYITHIGLYNEDNELLAIGKMTTPLRKPSDIPLTVRLQLDL